MATSYRAYAVITRNNFRVRKDEDPSIYFHPLPPCPTNFLFYPLSTRFLHLSIFPFLSCPLFSPFHSSYPPSLPPYPPSSLPHTVSLSVVLTRYMTLLITDSEHVITSSSPSLTTRGLLKSTSCPHNNKDEDHFYLVQSATIMNHVYDSVPR